jgi:hypothetical protein
MNSWTRLGTVIAILVATASWTTTEQSRNVQMPLNSACAFGFYNDRPCSY